MAGAGKGLKGTVKSRFLHQDIIGVIGGKGEQADPCFGQGANQGSEHAGQGERQGTLNFEAAPSPFAKDASRDLGLQADDGKLLRRSGDGS